MPICCLALEQSVDMCAQDRSDVSRFYLFLYFSLIGQSWPVVPAFFVLRHVHSFIHNIIILPCQVARFAINVHVAKQHIIRVDDQSFGQCIPPQSPREYCQYLQERLRTCPETYGHRKDKMIHLLI